MLERKWFVKLITSLFILNAVLLLLHEIESAYEKEWEILKLPGKITGFLLLHIPVIFLMLYGAIEVEKLSVAGMIIGIIFGIGGIIPLIVHKVLVKRKGKFDLPISNIIIYVNAVAGVATMICIVRLF
ncbi:MAG TPA: DUF6713 family protein [Clostridia bacterium]|nr:DUF6713 family protein [Clostridia bacterium]